MKRLKPLLLLAALALLLWILYCQIRGKKIVPLVGWSPYNSNPMPSSPAPSSNYMGTGSPLR